VGPYKKSAMRARTLSVSLSTSLTISVAVVLATVNLHYQLRFQRNEVHDEVTHRMLAPEFDSHLMVAQARP
jgi:hypothetical protein